MAGSREELLLRVVGLLLRGLLWVARVARLSGGWGCWVASLSWSRLVRRVGHIRHVGHVGHVVLAVGIGIVAHRHLEVPAWTT